jgi:hypothetical protein
MKRINLWYRFCRDTPDSSMNRCLEYCKVVAILFSIFFVLGAIISFFAYLCYLFPEYTSTAVECMDKKTGQLTYNHVDCDYKSSIFRCDANHVQLCYRDAALLVAIIILCTFALGWFGFAIYALYISLKGVGIKPTLYYSSRIIGFLLSVAIHTYFIELSEEFPFMRYRQQMDSTSLFNSYLIWWSCDTIWIGMIILCVLLYRHIKKETSDIQMQINKLIDV